MTVIRGPISPVIFSPLRAPTALYKGGGGAFSPLSLFAGGDILLWYDPSDLSTMFKDTAGTQPVTADGDSVALMLDKGRWGGKTLEQVLAAQPELVTDPSFDDAGSWTANANWAVTGGNAVATAASTNLQGVKQAVATVVGRSYVVTIVVSSISGSVAILHAGTRSSPFAAAGTYSVIYVATNTIHNFGVCSTGTPVTATIASISVKEIPGYHRVQATGTSMPKYKTDGTLHWLLYDGTDDGLATGTITWGTDEVAICAGVTKSSDAAAGAFAEFSANSSSNNGSFALLVPSAAADNLFWRSKGTAAADNTPTGFAAPSTDVLTGTGKIASDTSTLRANGAVSATSATDQGTGNFGSYPLYFGRRGGTTLPFNGREYQTVIRSRLLSAAELSSLETFVAEKTGVIL